MRMRVWMTKYSGPNGGRLLVCVSNQTIFPNELRRLSVLVVHFSSNHLCWREATNSNQPGSRNRQCCQSPRQGTARPLPYQEIFRAGHMILQNPSNLMVTEGTDMSSSRTKVKGVFPVCDSNYDMTSNLVTHFTPTHTALKRVGCARVWLT